MKRNKGGKGAAIEGREKEGWKKFFLSLGSLQEKQRDTAMAEARQGTFNASECYVRSRRKEEERTKEEGNA